MNAIEKFALDLAWPGAIRKLGDELGLTLALLCQCVLHMGG
jgi:hypothetical protein